MQRSHHVASPIVGRGCTTPSSRSYQTWLSTHRSDLCRPLAPQASRGQALEPVLLVLRDYSAEHRVSAQ